MPPKGSRWEWRRLPWFGSIWSGRAVVKSEGSAIRVLGNIRLAVLKNGVLG